jgi:hypothetical protein
VASQREERDKGGGERGDEDAGRGREAQGGRFDADLDVIVFVLGSQSVVVQDLSG